MKRTASITVVCLALAAGPALAGSPSSKDPPAASRGSVEKTYEGKVTEFASGKFLTIAMEGDKLQTFHLDEKDISASVDPEIAVGARVKVVDTRDASGKRTVTVKLAEMPAQAR